MTRSDLAPIRLGEVNRLPESDIASRGLLAGGSSTFSYGEP